MRLIHYNYPRRPLAHPVPVNDQDLYDDILNTATYGALARNSVGFVLRENGKQTYYIERTTHEKTTGSGSSLEIFKYHTLAKCSTEAEAIAAARTPSRIAKARELINAANEALAEFNSLSGE